MSRRPIGIVVNGVTGRMGYRQHLVRSLLAIRADGGLPAADGTVIWPEPILVGRDAGRPTSRSGTGCATGRPTSTRRWTVPTWRSTSTRR